MKIEIDKKVKIDDVEYCLDSNRVMNYGDFVRCIDTGGSRFLEKNKIYKVISSHMDNVEICHANGIEWYKKDNFIKLDSKIDEDKSIIKETRDKIKEIGKNVYWIGSKDGEYALSEEEFFNLKEIDYSLILEWHKIASDLVIVFCDGSYCDRVEFIGWDYKLPPQLKEGHKRFESIANPYSINKTLREINVKRDIKIGGNNE